MFSFPAFHLLQGSNFDTQRWLTGCKCKVQAELRCLTSARSLSKSFSGSATTKLQLKDSRKYCVLSPAPFSSLLSFFLSSLSSRLSLSFGRKNENVCLTNTRSRTRRSTRRHGTTRRDTDTSRGTTKGNDNYGDSPVSFSCRRLSCGRAIVGSTTVAGQRWKQLYLACVCVCRTCATSYTYTECILSVSYPVYLQYT